MLNLNRSPCGWLVINLTEGCEGRRVNSASSNPLFYISHSGKIVREICVTCMSETVHTHAHRASRESEPPRAHPSIISTKLQEILLYAHVYLLTYVNLIYIFNFFAQNDSVAMCSCSVSVSSRYMLSGRSEHNVFFQQLVIIFKMFKYVVLLATLLNS